MIYQVVIKIIIVRRILNKFLNKFLKYGIIYMAAWGRRYNTKPTKLEDIHPTTIIIIIGVLLMLFIVGLIYKAAISY